MENEKIQKDRGNPIGQMDKGVADHRGSTQLTTQKIRLLSEEAVIAAKEKHANSMLNQASLNEKQTQHGILISNILAFALFC